MSRNERTGVSIAAWVGRQVADVRMAVRWTQADLGRVANLSQSAISDIERGNEPDLTFRRAETLLDVMGARLRVIVDPPRVLAGRQRDPIHIRCSAHVSRRLRGAGWEVRHEVEIGGDRSRGWIDLLAYHPSTRSILVIEIKTEIRDIGELERALSWYEREAWTAGRRAGWRPRHVGTGVLLLATDENERLAEGLRAVLADRFPNRANDLTRVVETGELGQGGRGLGMIDPGSRRRTWIRRLRIDGRRSPAPYRDYLDAVRRLRA